MSGTETLAVTARRNTKMTNESTAHALGSAEACFRRNRVERGIIIGETPAGFIETGALNELRGRETRLRSEMAGKAALAHGGAQELDGTGDVERLSCVIDKHHVAAGSAGGFAGFCGSGHEERLGRAPCGGNDKEDVFSAKAARELGIDALSTQKNTAGKRQFAPLQPLMSGGLPLSDGKQKRPVFRRGASGFVKDRPVRRQPSPSTARSGHRRCRPSPPCRAAACWA